jgi:hypothetical protein
MYQHMFAQLADDLARTFADPQLLNEFLATLDRRNTARSSDPRPCEEAGHETHPGHSA